MHSLLVFGLSKLKMRVLEGLAKHLEHVNEKLFCSVLVDRVCGRMHPCCFGNETGIRSDPSVARIADNTAHMLRTPRAIITAKPTNCVGFWYGLLAVVGKDVAKVHCWYPALRSNELKLSHGSGGRKPARRGEWRQVESHQLRPVLSGVEWIAWNAWRSGASLLAKAFGVGCSAWLDRLQRLVHYITRPLLPDARAEY